MVLKEVMDKNPQKSEIQKYAILMIQPRNLTFLDNEIFQLFSYLYGLKVPTWNYAHILLSKTAKNIRKIPKKCLIYSLMTEDNLTEWHCMYLNFYVFLKTFYFPEYQTVAV